MIGLKKIVSLLSLVLISLFICNNISLSFNSNSGTPYFIENKGQYDENIKFYSINKGLNIWITENEIIFDEYKIDDENRVGEIKKIEFEDTFQDLNNSNAIQAKFNFFKGRHSDSWRTNVKIYRELDLISKQGIPINLSFEKNTLQMNISKTNLDLFTMKLTGFNSIEEVQDIFSLKSSKDIHTLKANSYSISQNDDYINLQIRNEDIQMSFMSDFYSSYLGGGGWDSSEEIIVDREKSIYIVGYTNSENFPTIEGAYSETLRANKFGYPDIFVSKFDSTGQNLLFSTFIGSQLDDFGKGIALDDSLNIYITGYTGPTTTFPITDNAYDTLQNGAYDVFLVKLNRYGDSINYSTYIGSSNDDFGQSVKVSTGGYVHLCGFTMENEDFPVTPTAIQPTHGGMNDAFYCKFDWRFDNLLSSTYLGGSEDEFSEELTVDDNNYVYIVGSTRSNDFPITPDAYDKEYNDTLQKEERSDAFVAMIHPTGEYLAYSTFLGGGNRDVAYAVETDKYGAFYVTGITESKDFPVTAYAYDTLYRSKEGIRTAGDIFVTKFHPNRHFLHFSTYVGGSSVDKAYDIEVSDDGYIYFVGSTSSFDMPVSLNPYQRMYNDSSFGADAMIGVLDSSGRNLVYSSFFGGNDHDIAYALNLVDDEFLYFTGTTTSKDFPISDSPFSSTYSNNSESDCFVSVLKPNLLTISAGGDNHGNRYACKGEYISIGSHALGARGAVSYSWTPEKGLSDPNIAVPFLQVTQNQTYVLHAVDSKGYEAWDTVHIKILPYIEANIYGPQHVFKLSKHTYGTVKNDFAKYKWYVTEGLILSSDTTNEITVKWGNGPVGTVKLITVNDIGCTDSSLAFDVEIGDVFIPKIIPLTETNLCDGQSAILDAGIGFESYLWSDGASTRFDTISVSGDYWVYVKDSSGFQAISDTISIRFRPSPPYPIINWNKNTGILSVNLFSVLYQWYHNGDPIQGANQRTYVPDRIGLYECEVGWTENSCTRFSDTLRLRFGDVDVVEHNYIENLLKLYPNPVEDRLIIEFLNEEFIEYTLKVHNTLGEELLIESISTKLKKYSIDLSHFISGIYFLTLSNKYDSYSFQLVKI